MPPINPLDERVEKDADALEKKYGTEAATYAETRGEAAESAGDDADKEHWEEVADTLEDGGSQ
jgi:hypothetical protein